MGSLLAATASFLDARSRSERWLLRIDDLDTPRVVPGAETQILRDLQAHGLHWDGPVDHQSAHLDAYEAALATLTRQGLLFYCECSRSQLANPGRYPGTCRHRVLSPTGSGNTLESAASMTADPAIRIRTSRVPVTFNDLIAGPCSESLEDSCGDFVVKRRDGQIAYQLATAVDDGSSTITRVVRGRDLLDNTPRQIFLMDCLGLQVPEYAHVPTLLNTSGQKLSKQNLSPALASNQAGLNLIRTLGYLGMTPLPDSARLPVGEILDWAVTNWSLACVPRTDVHEQ